MDHLARRRYQNFPHLPESSAMNWLRLPAAALALAGRHGTLVAAASIFIGLSVPPLSKTFKPYLGEAIIVMLTLAFLRVNPKELWARSEERRVGKEGACRRRT